MSTELCELINGEPCDHSEGVDLGDPNEDLQALGDLAAVEYVRADGVTYRHKFDTDNTVLTYAAPGVLVIIGHFTVDAGGIDNDEAGHDADDDHDED